MAKERLSSDSSEIKRRPRSVKKETETQKVQNASSSKDQSDSPTTNKKSGYEKGKLTSGVFPYIFPSHPIKRVSIKIRY